MTRSKMFAACVVVFSILNPAEAKAVPTPGPAEYGGAIAYYYTWSGEITISVNDVDWWYLQSVSSSLTGDPVANLPSGLGLVTDNDEFIGESGFGFTFTDLELGAVAQPYLPDQMGTTLPDLRLRADQLGSDSLYWPLVYIYIPEPSSIMLAAASLGILITTHSRRIRSVR